MSEHFKESEFSCHCGCGQRQVSPHLLDGLEELREIIDKPIKVLSGVRCKKQNAKVQGAADSRHLTGCAADITADIPLVDLFRAASSVMFFFAGGIGIYPGGNFLHVDVRDARARWGYVNGRYCGFAEAWAVAKGMSNNAT